MIDKALISDLTWRSLDMQNKVFSNMPIFVAPDDITSLLRPTRRTESLRINVLSLGVIAETEKNFIYILENIRKKKANIYEEETRTEYHYDCPITNVLNAWKVARRDGAAKIGAKISAEKKKASTKESIQKIKHLWPTPSKEHPTKELLALANLSLNTVKANLGSRLIAQYNYRAKLKRQERLKAASNAKYPRMKRATNYIDEAPND